MKNLRIEPGYQRTDWLHDHIESFGGNLDTDSDLTDITQMKHIGADLYVPRNMQMFNINVAEVKGITIRAIEVTYVADRQDFTITQLLLSSATDAGTSDGGRTVVDIDGKILRSIPLDRYKRAVIGAWILQDHGPNSTPRWSSWKSLSQYRDYSHHTRGGTELELQEVARFYVAGRNSNKDAIEEVARVFDMGRSTASRWINKAREAGYVDQIAPVPLPVHPEDEVDRY